MYKQGLAYRIYHVRERKYEIIYRIKHGGKITEGQRGTGERKTFSDVKCAIF